MYLFKRMTKKKTTIIGHRGCGSSGTGGISLYPENSFFSFENAANENIDGIELDVWLTKDNHVVVIHGTEDGRIGNTVVTDDKLQDRYIEELTSDEIRSLHFREPWSLTIEKNCNTDTGCSNMFSVLSKNENIEKQKAYEQVKGIYVNTKERQHIEKIIKKFMYDTSGLNNIEHLKCETSDELGSSSDAKTSTASFASEQPHQREDVLQDSECIVKEDIKIKCHYCEYIYEQYMQNGCDDPNKRMFLQYIMMFYHVPLLKDVLSTFQNKLSYDIELKGTKETLGLYILDILKGFMKLDVKFSSFQWILHDDKIKKKINKHKNLKNFDYSLYPFHNKKRIDQLRVLKNNDLNIPIALLFCMDAVMPNFNSILSSMNYYNAQWAHFSHRLYKQPLVLNCNKKDKIVSFDSIINMLHKNDKKIMIYWGSEEKDSEEDILFFLNGNVDSVCLNDIHLGQNILLKHYNQAVEKDTVNEKQLKGELMMHTVTHNNTDFEKYPGTSIDLETLKETRVSSRVQTKQKVF